MKFEKFGYFFFTGTWSVYARELVGVTSFKQKASKVEPIEIGIGMTLKETR